MRLTSIAALATICTLYSASSISATVPITSCETTQCKQEFKGYKKLAKNGSAQAQMVLAGMFYSGYGTERSSKKALKWYRLASKTRHSGFAAYRAGLIMLFDQEIERDIEKGMTLLAKAARMKSKDAAYQLADIYIQGELVAQDLNQAEGWLIMASELNHAKSQYRLGLLYEAGVLGEPQPQQAIALYQKAAEKNNIQAIERLQLLGTTSDKEDVFAATRGNNIERIAVNAPELSKLLNLTLTSIKETGRYNHPQSCSRIRGSHCDNVITVTGSVDIENALRPLESDLSPDIYGGY